MIVLVGALAQPGLRAALDLSGPPVQLRGRLERGGRAGIDRDGWPELVQSDDPLLGMAVEDSPALTRYAKVMGLQPHAVQGHAVLGIGAGGQGDALPEALRDALAAEIARQILDADPSTDPDLLAWRLPMTGIWAASRLRAQAMAPSGQGVVAPRGAGAVTALARHQPFLGYFGVARNDLTHALHQGGTSAPMTREAFLMGDAAVLLPWDPVRDRVLVIEQFRFAPALRGDPQPWLLEPIAGRVDAGETPEAAILREAREEAGLQVTRLVPALHSYPSPGAVCEFLYQYVGIADLPDGIAGIHGLEGEAEDIRGHLMDRAALSALVDAGQITNGPLALLSLWLDARADRLRGEPASA
ncbi:NUDIX domain-containing protein [Paracoccus gahaiensis]|uniref:NUDIX domain-containing protein n=1 Tax=Paracoccus gahaiensis TaxID=1706839 RepID=A0A4U0REI0_9RHOB|nr:NUDIX domain-containing protein [Paracoccus gahaiensis]TJZ93705.1 NUDIX domain-containing protein [Paracoccus gahaiensis]